MTRSVPFTGPGDFLLLATLMWLAAAGIVLAWLSSPPASATGSDLRSAVYRMANGDAK